MPHVLLIAAALGAGPVGYEPTPPDSVFVEPATARTLAVCAAEHQQSVPEPIRPQPWDIPPATDFQLTSFQAVPDAGGGAAGDGGAGGGGGGNLAGDATNPTSNLIQFQLQNTFVPNSYGASGYANAFAIQPVIPFETGLEFFPTYITRTTIPIFSTADPDAASEFVGLPGGGGGDSSSIEVGGLDLGRQGGLGDITAISILNHPTEWGSWGIGPGFVFPSATHPQLGERSWKFAPTFAVINTAQEGLQVGIVGFYAFPMDGRGTKSLAFQPILVQQLGKGWYTGWGDDLWTFNSESGNYDMPLQWRLGRVYNIGEQPVNVFLTGFYTPDDFHKGPAPEWGFKFNISLLFPG